MTFYCLTCHNRAEDVYDLDERGECDTCARKRTRREGAALGFTMANVWGM